jgi:hypothetical protein
VKQRQAGRPRVARVSRQTRSVCAEIMLKQKDRARCRFNQNASSASLEHDEISLIRKGNGSALPLPLAGEGWGGGASARRAGRVDRASPTKTRFARRPPPQAGEVSKTLLTGRLNQISSRARYRPGPASAACFVPPHPRRPCRDCRGERPEPLDDACRWQRRRARACWSR